MYDAYLAGTGGRETCESARQPESRFLQRHHTLPREARLLLVTHDGEHEQREWRVVAGAQRTITCSQMITQPSIHNTAQ